MSEETIEVSASDLRLMWELAKIGRKSDRGPAKMGGSRYIGALKAHKRIGEKVANIRA